MSYKFSRGSQVIGDLKAADDTQRDTLIDFGQDQIEFQTSGSTRLKVDNDGAEITGSLQITNLGDQNEIVIVGADNVLTSSNLLAIDTNNDRVGIGTSSPSVKLDMVGEAAGETQIRMAQHNTDSDAPDIRLFKSRGTEASPTAVANADNLARVNSFAYNGSGYVQAGSFGWSADGTDGDSTFDIKTRVGGSNAIRLNVNASGEIVFNNAYRFPTSDGSANQVLQTNGSGQLSFVDVDDGGGGSDTPEVLKVGLSSDFTLSGSGTYQTLTLTGVQFDTFTGGAGWNTGSYNFVATEAGYYEIQGSFIFDVIQNDITQYQIYLVSSSSASTYSNAGVPFLALNQYNNNPAEIDMRTFHLNTIAHFSVNQSASIQVRQIGGTGNQTKIKKGLNQTVLTIRKL